MALRTMLLSLIALALAACESTPKQVEAEGATVVAQIQAPPATAYRRLTQAARECFADKAFRVDADFFPDVNEGRVTLALTRITNTLVTAKLSPGPANTTTIRASHQGWGEVAERGFVPWAKGEPGYCITDSFKPRPQPDPSR